MYPFKPNQTYPLNQWYIAAWSQEVQREMLARTLLGKAVVLFRTEAGDVAALANRCPHRGYPLSKGKLIGDIVQCGYHGFEFNHVGACVGIPAQDNIPETHQVRAFPVVERWKWIWIWMGDPDLADAATIPEIDILNKSSDEWLSVGGGAKTIKCRYQLLNENLLDLSHLSYLHSGSVGSPGVAKAKVNMSHSDDRLCLSRDVRSDSLEDTQMGRAFGLRGPIDRKMSQDFFVPGVHMTGSDYDSALADGIDPGKHFASLRVLHAVTPETPQTTHYFWGFVRDFKKDDHFTEAFQGVVRDAVMEDIDALEAVEQMLQDEGESFPEISSKADMASFRGRVLVQKQIERDPSGSLK